MVRQCLNVVMWLRVYTCMHVHVHVHGCVCVCMCLECRMLIVVHRYNAFVEVRTPFRIWLLLPPCEVGSLLVSAAGHCTPESPSSASHLTAGNQDYRCASPCPIPLHGFQRSQIQIARLA